MVALSPLSIAPIIAIFLGHGDCPGHASPFSLAWKRLIFLERHIGSDKVRFAFSFFCTFVFFLCIHPPAFWTIVEGTKSSAF